MSYSSYLASNRAVLFANLGQALHNGDKFPEIFDNVADISPDCFAKSLAGLANAVREQPDKPLLEHMKEAPLFLAWELRFIQFGLATLKIEEVFARLCEYYVMIGQPTGRLMRWTAGLWGILSFTGGYLAYVLSPVSTSLWYGVGTLVLLLIVGVLAASPAMGGWVAPDSRFWRLAARLPQFRSLVVARSVYQYLLNLGLCIQGGMDLSRSLKVCAKSEPISWLRQRYQGVAADVANGNQISKAFIASGILAETRITAQPKEQHPKGGKLWEPGITDIVRQSYTDQLDFAARFLPLLLMVPLAVIWVYLALQ
ncbi:type II secretion system F family protein [Hahella ganghwensis]|uniref:type II secretion system F family protein n=1 Tax=Hahella ganghwensis TaxID=286420 RepID=UPI00036EAA41|nr:type II secretion system F family protein [Hahella ganghwensis]